MTYCRRHGRRTDVCGCSRSYPCLVCGGLFPGSDHVCPGEHAQPTDSRSEPDAGNPPTEAREAGRQPHSKVWREVFENCVDGRTESWWSEWLWQCPCGDGGPYGTWAEAMDAAHAHVREHHTPTWQPCGRGICAAESGHEGTCAEASGWADAPPELYDLDDVAAEFGIDLDAHRDAMDADTLADPIARQILAGETNEDDWIDAPPPFGNVPKALPKETVIRLEPDVKDQLQAVLDRFRIPYREHHDDGRVVDRNYGPDPSSEAWRDLLATSREDT